MLHCTRASRIEPIERTKKLPLGFPTLNVVPDTLYTDHLLFYGHKVTDHVNLDPNMEYLLRIGEREFLASRSASSNVDSDSTSLHRVPNASNSRGTQFSLGKSALQPTPKISKKSKCLNCGKTFSHGGNPCRMIVDDTVEVYAESGDLIEAIHLKEDSDRGFHPNCYSAVWKQIHLLSDDKSTSQDMEEDTTESIVSESEETEVRIEDILGFELNSMDLVMFHC